MNSIDLIRMSLLNLWRRKARTILTIVGVMIGTCSIVVMMSLGIAMDQNFQQQLANMGSLHIIEVYTGYYGPGSPGGKQEVYLDDKAVAAFEKIEGAAAVMPLKRSYFKFAAGKLVSEISVIGIKPENMEAFDFKTDQGRLLNPGDKDAVVFGSNTIYNFYNPRLGYGGYYYYGQEDMPPPTVNVLSDKLLMTADMEYGQRQTVSDRDPDYVPPPIHDVKGVGILQISNDERDYSVYMNITALDKILAEDLRATQNSGNRSQNEINRNKYDSIRVKCQDIQKVTVVQNAIKELGYETWSLTDSIESMKQLSRTMQMVLGGIGAISLLVAAIGITNTMVMSIYERTKEIGIIKVLGADLGDIKKLFLIEAAFIGLFGGIIGLILSYGLSWGLNHMAFSGFMYIGGGGDKMSVIPPYIALGALAFSTMVGIIAGYSPAHRAMNLSVLEAIRTE